MYFIHIKERLLEIAADNGQDGTASFAQQVLTEMNNAVLFHLGDIGEWWDNGLCITEDNAADILRDAKSTLPMPYDVCWVDFQDSKSPYCPKGAILLVKHPEDQSILLLSFDYYKLNGVWFPIPFMIQVKDNEIAFHSALNIPGADIDSLYQELQPNLARATNIGCTFLRLINCRNIETQDIQPSRVLNANRRRKKRLPFVSYKVLNLKCPSNKKATSTKKDPTGAHNRVHLCRGHFKTFTEDAPLLGKHVGTYWWQPTVRGTKSKGLVNKEYHVKTS